MIVSGIGEGVLRAGRALKRARMERERISGIRTGTGPSQTVRARVVNRRRGVSP
jgi:hypothetical protein